MQKRPMLQVFEAKGKNDAKWHFLPEKAILQFLEENGSKVCKMSSCGEERPPKMENGEKMAHVAKFVLLLPTNSNRKQSRRIEENRERIEENGGESRRIEENRGESRNRGSRRIEENRGEQENEEETGEKNGNVAKKRQCLTFWLALPSLSSIFTQLSHVSPIFAHLPNFPQFSSYSPHFHPFSALFPFVSVFSPSSPHFQQISAVLRLFFHPFSAEFSRSQMVLKRSPSFRPVFPIFHPISPKNKRSLPEKKHVNNIFKRLSQVSLEILFMCSFTPKMKEPQEHVNTFLPPTQSVDNPPKLLMFTCFSFVLEC